MKIMKIIIGISHFPHWNFFKNAAILLNKKYDIKFFIFPRGNLMKIVENENKKIPYFYIGYQGETLYSKILEYLKLDFKLFLYLRKNPYDLSVGVGDLGLAHVSKILSKPYINFVDDIDTVDLMAHLPFSKKTFIPSSIEIKGRNIYKYNGFKELAYLHPNYFSPDKVVLDEYKIENLNYIFMRIVETSTINYRHLNNITEDLIKVIRELTHGGFKIVLSLENKGLKDMLKNYCIILEEPVSDIHSLMYYADLTISTGDSMARESCLLGTPAIYLGRRDMPVHQPLIDKGCFFKIDNISDVTFCAKEIIEKDIKSKTRKKINNAITNEWTDTTQVIIDAIESEIYNDLSLIEKYKNAGRVYNEK